MGFLNRKCTNLVARSLNEDEIEDETVKSASSEDLDQVAGNESSETSDSSESSDSSSESDTGESESEDLPDRSFKQSSAPSKAAKHLNSKVSEAKQYDPEDPNRHINRNPEKNILGFDYHSPPSLAADESRELEPLPDYVEPSPAELDLIAEDILQFGVSNESSSTSTSESESESSDAEDAPSSPEGIVNFQPLNKKPCFKFSPSSSLTSRLPDFLTSMKAANDSLQADIVAGKQGHLLEIDEAVEHEEEEERPYIEMDLGLGVLEETPSHTESSADEVDITSGSIVGDGGGKSATGKPLIIEEL
jgi:hypothetical protein